MYNSWGPIPGDVQFLGSRNQNEWGIESWMSGKLGRHARVPPEQQSVRGRRREGTTSLPCRGVGRCCADINSKHTNK